LHDEVGTFAGKSGLDVLICVGSLAERIARRRRRRECPRSGSQKFANAEAAAGKFRTRSKMAM